MDTYEAAMDGLQWPQSTDHERRQPLWLVAVLLIAVAANIYAGNLRHQQQMQTQTPSSVQQTQP